MFSRRLTRSIAVVAAVVVVGSGGAYGIVTATSSSGSGTGSAATPAQVIPFNRGQPSPTQVVGQIPPSYVQGGGTIVAGTAADMGFWGNGSTSQRSTGCGGPTSTT